ncbi:flagellar hook-associated protein FlgK [Clostridium estertheticum]|uniref:flagellar hook-associated protein FlgK n=1 Tax=Clostridium estertheticum TaxID=238834 RepID=UPI001CF2DC4E|nr:flagellar hook-associated protein FlgK [Clostridium estertheticum]MCB2308804.1 flagellar hook-associated protein FlgK [Clostridium estertheticum]MCB2347118.1 flagellar hook-associated protein FlgK [Clostridium estertheticum]MCB2351790.1 flagellar hook-associated protein FlgK [Clostridium estertheticum]WAG44488.1 flagellar hook-associated protein FlgK [Clostridium estertheticum]
MSGLFSTMNVAVRGMTAQQMAIDVTSHNIANANTDGYSRQRTLMETTTPFGMPSMNNAVGPGQLGTGVQVSSITRIRDTYLDYQVRAENGTMGLYQGREKFLTEVQSIFNEVSETGVSNMLSEVFKSWSALSTSPESSNTRTVVAQKSKALTDQLNSTYNQLSKLKINCQDVIQKDVTDINGMLDQINDLNQQVISVKVGGNEPNDLMDKRDLLVDQLSSKFGITIDKKALAGEDLKATDNVGGADPTKDLYFVKSDPTKDVSRFSYVSTIVPSKGSIQKPGETGSYDVTYYKNGDTSTDANKVTMTMQLSDMEYTSLDQGRVLWADKEGYAIDASSNRINGIDSNSKAIPQSGTKTNTDATWGNIKRFEPKTGEINGYQSVQTDIDTYINDLNNMAKAIAYSVNAVHSGNQADTAGELKFFVNSTTAGKEEEITAGNIAVNGEIIKDVMLIKVGKGDTPLPTDGSRALAISKLRDVKLNIQSIGAKTTRAMLLSGDTFSQDTTLGVKMVNATSDGMTIIGDFTNITNRLADKTQYAKNTVINNTKLLAGLEESRTSISGVSLDEEMANLVQIQHAYAANAKIISTVDELLDLIVNGLKK